MKIQNDDLASVGSAASRVDQVSAGTQGAGKSGGAQKSQTDQVEVSSATEKITAQLSSQSAERAARVQQLSALYSSGKYQVDSSQVSQSMIAGALSGTNASV
jgi:flagellar biosynthesis anti-sigma factor FlgM